MKKRKIIKTIFAAAIAMLGVYFFSSFSYQYIGGLYYSQLYKKRLAEKTKTKPVTYYISAEGNDTNNGLSQSSAWQSFLNINNIDLNPGDSILLKGGDTITGNLNLTGNDLGTKEKPLVISSFGGGNASIYTVAGDAIRAVNSQGISISNLIINGCGPAKNNNSGIAIINDLPGDIKLPFIRINNVDASGFGFCGILIDGNNGKSGFTDVVISNSSFHDNGEAGLYVYGKFTTNEGEYAHEKVHIRYVKAYNNAGKPGKDIQNSGSGIVLSDVNSGLIEHCTTYKNGWQCESLQGGPVGIWAWDSNNIIIQHNESYQNKTNGGFDGGGFDLDGGMRNSIIQYNYSHDNDGPGILLAQFSYARKHLGNVVRYNISENDCRKNRYGAIHVWGNVEDAVIYNNTIFNATPSTSQAYGLACRYNEDQRISKNFPSQLSFLNNIFYVNGSLPVISSPEADTSFHLVNNYYYTLTKFPVFEWSNRVYKTLDDWRRSSGQEQLQSKHTGFTVDPLFKNPGKGIVFNNTDSMILWKAYCLQQESPLLNKGIRISSFHKLAMASKDFNNQPIPADGLPEPGACEYVSLPGKN